MNILERQNINKQMYKKLEYINQNNRLIKTKVIILNTKNDIKIIIGSKNEIKKNYVQNISVVISDKLITTNLADSLEFKNELKLFSKGDQNNKFWKIVERTVSSKQEISLKLKIKNFKIFISRSEAAAMAELWHLCLYSYNFSQLLEDQYSLTNAKDEWLKAIDHLVDNK